MYFYDPTKIVVSTKVHPRFYELQISGNHFFRGMLKSVIHKLQIRPNKLNSLFIVRIFKNLHEGEQSIFNFNNNKSI